MITLLIVEDNQFERDSLRDLVNWNLVGVSSILTAVDGQDGLDMITKHNPDIVLTDIKMPHMDGLSMLDRANSLGVRAKFVYCSAFEEFSYVQQAMRKGAANYLLKPIHQKELIQTIREVINSIIDDKLYEDERIRYRAEYEVYLDKIRMDFIKELVLTEQRKKMHSGYPIMSDIYHKMSAGYGVASIEILYESGEIPDKQALNERLLSALTASKKINNAEFFYNDVGLLIILLHAIKNENDLHDLVAEVQHIADGIKKEAAFDYFIGVSSISMCLSEINRLYLESCRMLEKRFLLGCGTAAYYDNADESKSLSQLDQSILHSAISSIVSKTLSGQDIDSALLELEKILKQHYEHRINRVQGVLINLISDLLSHSYSHACSNTDPEYEIYQNIINARSLPGALAFVKQFCEGIRDQIATNSKNKTDKLVEQITTILRTEYHENITLHYLSKKVYLSPNYIRLIFKEKTNVSVLEYLIGIRMEKARELLLHTDLNVGDIADRVGYANSSYFCTAFKSESGMSPSEFRRSVKGKGED